MATAFREPLLEDGGSLATTTRPSGEGNNSKGDHNTTKTSWQQTTFIIVTSFLGAGVLSLPYSLSRLGWIPFYFLLFAVCGASLIASDCYGRLFKACPEAKVLADVAGACYGKTFEKCTTAAVYAYIGGICLVFQLTATIALQECVGGGCAGYLGLITSALAFAGLQFRSMHDLSGLAILGSVAILVPCAILLIALPVRGRRPNAKTDLAWPPSSTLVDKGVGAMDLAFAYAGQVIFVELQSGMKEPGDFMKAVVSSASLMTFTYALVAAVGYWFVGQKDLNDGAPISSKLAKGAPTQVVNAFIFVHVLVAYAVEGNVLARGILHALGRDDAAEKNTPQARLAWTTVTAATVAGAYTVCQLVPFFSDVMSFVSGVCGVALNFTMPLVFVLELAPPKSLAVRRLFKLLIALSVIVALGGTTAATIDVVNKFKLVPPFTC